VENVVSHYVKFDKHNLQLNTASLMAIYMWSAITTTNSWPVNFTPTIFSQWHYSSTTENTIIIHGYILLSEYCCNKSEFSDLLESTSYTFVGGTPKCY